MPKNESLPNMAETERDHEMEQRVEWSLLLGAIGDGMGMPYERLTREEILKLTGGKDVADFVDPIGIRKDDKTPWKIGQWTDDTQLSLVVAQSLSECGKWNPQDCMKRHVTAINESSAGWGKSTKTAVRNFAANLERDKNFIIDADHPPVSKPGEGGGNGPLMKVAPLALFTSMEFGGAVPEDILAKRATQLSFLTHGDPQAALAAYAGALLTARGLESPIRTAPAGLEFLKQITEKIKKLELQLEKDGIKIDHEKTLSHTVAKIPGVINDYAAICELANNDKNPFLGRTSTILTIALFLRNFDDVRQGVNEAIGAGGDTDTNASILGNFYGAHGIYKNIPEAWLNFMKNHASIYEPVRTAGRDLFQSARRARDARQNKKSA